MSIEISGLPIDRALRARVSAQLTRALRTVHGGPVHAHVTFADVNGPKGGPDIRCAFTIQMPRRRALHVENIAESPRLAFDAGVESLARRLAELTERRRDLRRRPKKYFVAKTLLTGGTAT
jgi:ribosome-associated translation inhibitor RaiA